MGDEDLKRPIGGVGRTVGMIGEGVLHWEPVIRVYGDNMVGDIPAGGSSSSGELSLDSGLGEESELWVRSWVRSICHVLRVLLLRV